jgi:hypothetical protein
MRRTYFAVGLIIGILSASLSAQTAEVSVSNRYVPDLSLFSTPKKRKPKPDKARAESSSRGQSGSKSIWLALSVFDNHWEPVTGLKADEVEIAIDGENGKVIEFDSGADKIETVFVVDMSPSTAFEVDDIQSLVEKVIDKLPPTQKITIWKFDAKPQLLLESSVDRVAVRKAIKKLRMNSGTSLYDTVSELCSRKSAEPERPRMIFLVTDGVDTTSNKITAVESLTQSNECGDVFFPVYLDTYQYHADRVKNLPRTFANIPGLIPGLNANPIRKEDFDLGRHYLTSLLNMSGGRAFLLPLAKAELDEFSSRVAAARLSFYSIRVELDSRRAEMDVQASVKRPNLNVLTRSVVKTSR